MEKHNVHREVSQGLALSFIQPGKYVISGPEAPLLNLAITQGKNLQQR